MDSLKVQGQILTLEVYYSTYLKQKKKGRKGIHI